MDRTLAFAYPLVIPDNQFSITGSSDATKILKFEVDTQATASTLTFDVGAQTTSRTLFVPVLSANDTIVTLAVSQTLTGINTFTNATGAVTSQTGAIVQNGGAPSTSVGIGSGNVNAGNLGTFGGALVVGSTGTFGGVLTVNAANSSITLNGTAGDASVYFAIAGTNKGQFYGNATKPFGFFDNSNVTTVLEYTAGAINTGFWTFRNTTTASTSLLGALVVGNGVAATSVGIGGGYAVVGAATGTQFLRVGTDPSLALSSTAVRAGVYDAGATSTTVRANTLLRLSSNGNGSDGTIQFTDAVANNSYISQTSGDLRILAGTIGTSKVRIENTTAAASSITGSLIVGDLTAATTVAIGGGNINAGGTLVVGSTTDSTTTATGSVITAGGVGVAKRSYLGTIGAAFKGNVDAGVQDGTAAVAGQVGEVLSSVVSGVAVAATGTVGNVTSVSVTAGAWMVYAFGIITGGATGLTVNSTAKLSIVTTTATNGTSGSTMAQESVLALLANGLFELNVLPVPINISATTTYYLTEEVTFSAGSPTVAASLIFVRIR